MKTPENNNKTPQQPKANADVTGAGLFRPAVPALQPKLAETSTDAAVAGAKPVLQAKNGTNLTSATPGKVVQMALYKYRDGNWMKIKDDPADGKEEVKLPEGLREGDMYDSVKDVYMPLGTSENPHMVREYDYCLLDSKELDHHVIAPSISGCAAIKINLFSRAKGTRELVRSAVFHSDASVKSLDKATELGRALASTAKQDKTLDAEIFIVTNARSNKTGENIRDIMPLITKELTQAEIPYGEAKHLSLKVNIPAAVNVDMTGSEKNITENHSQYLQESESDKTEKAAQIERYAKLLDKRKAKGLDKVRKLKKGRKVFNPDFIEVKVDIRDFKRLDLHDMIEEADKLEGQIAKKAFKCFITTACTSRRRLPDDCEELMLLRWFRDNYMQTLEEGPELIALYYQVSPVIVEAIDELPDADAVYDRLYAVIRSCVGHIKQQRYADTLAIYTQMVKELAETYHPDYRLAG